jgi:riboflavin kinase / FMN adenylyltransferase
MKIHEGYENLNLIAPVATLGIFDGVHRGHMAVLKCLVSGAAEGKGESVVITFSPHPRMVLDQNKSNLSFLTTMEEKIVLLENANIDHLVIIEFNNLFSKIKACDFIKDILIDKIGVKHLIIGYNHHFGLRGEGDFNTIQGCSGQLGFRVEQVPGYQTEEGTISSSRIREALINGRIDEANRWLGYPYSVTGTIIEGRKLGRTLGFPTANIKPDSQYKLLPNNGVYAVDVQLDDRFYKGMLSIGSNPTVNEDIKLRSIEVYILDFDTDIYGKKISVIFRKRLRDEKKYDNIKQLTDQMKKDLLETKRLLT